jgi:ABC-2 type transport system ATP-binding protein
MPMTAASYEHAVVAQDLVKIYPGDVRALNALSLFIAPGEVFGLLGPNGAGKTTTTNILTTLAVADSGRAQVAGHDVRTAPRAVRRRIGVVSQGSSADPTASGHDNLLLQARLYGLTTTQAKRRTADLLERFDLTAAAARHARTYSGGMRRRLEMALGLIGDPEVVFLDEPTTGLDPESRAAMWQAIRELARDRGATVVFTTHYLDEADQFADRVAIIDQGSVVAEGTPARLKDDLGGDAIHVDLHRSLDSIQTESIRHTLEELPQIRDVQINSRRVSTRTNDSAAAVPLVLGKLVDVPVAAVTAAKPSLDDVYLRHAGRRFAEANHTEGAGK